MQHHWPNPSLALEQNYFFSKPKQYAIYDVIKPEKYNYKKFTLGLVISLFFCQLLDLFSSDKAMTCEDLY